MRWVPILMMLGLVAGGCSGPTLPSGHVPIPGSLIAESDAARNGSLDPFDPAAQAVGAAEQVTVTGFVPGDLCGQSLSASYSRAGDRLFVTLTSRLRSGRVCLTWIAETHYTVTLTALEPADYEVFVVQNPARRVINGHPVVRVDTLTLGEVTVGDGADP